MKDQKLMTNVFAVGPKQYGCSEYGRILCDVLMTSRDELFGLAVQAFQNILYEGAPYGEIVN